MYKNSTKLLFSCKLNWKLIYSLTIMCHYLRITGPLHTVSSVNKYISYGYIQIEKSSYRLIAS